ncbi:unnamed protein product [Orchesella dallaii]|uniref:Kazal-like domain-containing protein n=1 Tax=Orchesella dallaii TaxID=48710 RepID=A0ABP1QSA5_9HEXA
MKSLIFIGILVAGFVVFTSVSVSEGACACPYVYFPVCGSDGVTYSSTCDLECEMKNNTDLTLAREGDCDESKEDDKVKLTV